MKVKSVYLIECANLRKYLSDLKNPIVFDLVRCFDEEVYSKLIHRHAMSSKERDFDKKC